MEMSSDGQESPEQDDKILLGKYVDIPASNEIRTDNLCIDKVMGGRLIKKTVVHSVLQQA